MRCYRALVGLEYPTPRGGRRVEAGEVAEDLPAGSLAWLLEQGLVELVEEVEDGALRVGPGRVPAG
jgi:hypothetical protein